MPPFGAIFAQILKDERKSRVRVGRHSLKNIAETNVFSDLVSPSEAQGPYPRPARMLPVRSEPPLGGGPSNSQPWPQPDVGARSPRLFV